MAIKYGRELLKTDRNGTKYWLVTEKCPRCGGTGDYVLGGFDYGTCFQCGGRCFIQFEDKEYTPEYEAKLEARRKAKAQKRAEEARRYSEEHAEEIEAERRECIIRRYAEWGCGADGVGYVLTGNTYKAKEQIKRNGGRWIYGVWVCPVEIKGQGITARKISLNGHVGCGSEVFLNGFDPIDLIHQ